MQRSYPRPSLAVALLLVIWSVLGQSLVGLVIGLIPGGAALYVKHVAWISVGIELLLIGLPTVLYYHRYPYAEEALRLKPLKGVPMLAIVAAGAVGLLMFNLLTNVWIALLEWLGYAVSTVSSIPIPTDGPSLLISLLSIAVAPAVCEELLFRGMVLPSAEYPSGSRRAIALSGILFAMMHGSLEGLPIHIMLGILLGIFAVYTGSLYAPMLYHFSHNATSVLLAYWAQRNIPLSEETYEAMEPLMAVEWMRMLPMLLLLAGIWYFLCRFAVHQAQLSRAPGVLPRIGKQPKVLRIAIGVLILLLAGIYVLNAMPI